MTERITRKEIKHDIKHDRFVEEVNSFYGSFRSNAKSFAAVLMAIAALVGIGCAVWVWRAHREVAAQNRLAEGIDIMSATVGPAPAQPGDTTLHYKTLSEKIAKAEPIFQDVAAKHSGTDAADVADIYLARLAAGRGDLEGARKRYAKFIDDHPRSILAGSAQLSIYELQLAKGELKPAIASLEKELKDDSSKLPKDAVLAMLGRAYEQSGDATKARDVNRRITNEFPESAYARDAQRFGPAV
ncbi:MAG TPA: tetratricopeptide repeat protein [Thermoanaerobaculia bacterium]|nr:tetratricopeptide repeat protein [Thermoanaerobaculia bacterium]